MKNWRTKVLEGATTGDLERAVNRWMDEDKEAQEIVDIKLAGTIRDGFGAMIIYVPKSEKTTSTGPIHISDGTRRPSPWKDV